jgi:hypothetical protein
VSWSKLCGTFAFHHKVLEAGNEAAGAFVRMISYSSEAMTGGRISTVVALQIAPQAVLDRLVDARMLERPDANGPYFVHDYGDYNPTGPDLEQRKAELKAKRAEAGRRGAERRWQTHGNGSPDDGQGKGDGNLNGKDHGNLPTDGKTDGKQHGKNMAPFPFPSPSPESVTEEIAPTAPLTLTGEPATNEISRKPKSKRPPKHTSDQIAAKDALVEHFIRTVETKKGIDPKVDHAGDHAAAFALVLKFGPEATAIVTRALEDPFILSSNCTLRYIASKPDSWRGTAPAKMAKASHMVQPVPASGRAWEMGSR